jgi:diguanylate cyclase (GGDEF)-like protein/PAS domain S-box-containing protein
MATTGTDAEAVDARRTESTGLRAEASKVALAVPPSLLALTHCPPPPANIPDERPVEAHDREHRARCAPILRPREEQGIGRPRLGPSRGRDAGAPAKASLHASSELQRLNVELRRLWNAIEHSSVAVVVTDVDGRVEYVNSGFTKVTGYEWDEMVGQSRSLLEPEHTHGSDDRTLWSTVREGGEWRGEFCNRRKDGSLYWGSASVTPVKAADGTITHFVSIQTDISERKRAEEELRASEQRFRSLIETSLLGICIERDGRPLFVNQSFADIFGYAGPAEIIRLGSLEPLYVQEDLARVTQSRGRGAERDAGGQFEVRGVKKDGSLIWLHVHLNVIPWKGGPALQSTVVDVTLRKSYEARLHYQANYDPVTDLPNRALALDRLASAIANARRRQHRLAALFIDVDQFKTINDTLGHAVGDRLLRQVASRIKMSVREEDTVARLGGDEFVVVLPEIRHRSDAEAVAGKILEAVRHPLVADGFEISTSVSVGVAVFPEQGDDAEALMRHADAAMYMAKADGRGTVRLFTPELEDRNYKRLRLEGELRCALQRDQLTLHFQPLVDIRSGRIVGAEALIRWFSPEFGQISAQQLVRLAEHTGLIVGIGEWVLERGCREARRWRDAGFGDLSLSINVSGRQFRGNSLIDAIRGALTTHGLRAASLALEFTESLVLEDAAETRSVLAGLRAHGLRLAVDDFGTGYSSVRSLGRVSLDALKLDPCFTTELLTNPGQATLVDALILMAHRLKLSVIAEGVESREQLDILRGRGCDFAQGYYFSPPLPADDFLTLLDVWPSRTARAS